MNKPRLVHRENGDRLVILPGHDFPETAFHPEKWRIKEEIICGRKPARVIAGTRRLMVKPVHNWCEGNTAFTEARILLEMRKRGIRAEKPFAVYFRDGFKPMLLTKFVKPDAGVTWRDKLPVAEREKEANAEKGVVISDGEYSDNVIIHKGKPVRIDAERGHFVDANLNLILEEEKRLRRNEDTKDARLLAPQRSVAEFIAEVRSSLKKRV